MKNQSAIFNELVSQIRAEVDEALAAKRIVFGQEQDGFKTSEFVGKRPGYERLAHIGRGQKSHGRKPMRRGMNPAAKARPGEIKLGEFVQSEMIRRRVSASVVYLDLKRGSYPEVDVRRVNCRVSFVTVRALPLYGPNEPQAGEMPLKEFIFEECKRGNVTARTIYNRIHNGKYPHLQMRRVNHYLVFVKRCGVGIQSGDNIQKGTKG